jgi:hypothetical protein
MSDEDDIPQAPQRQRGLSPGPLARRHPFHRYNKNALQGPARDNVMNPLRPGGVDMAEYRSTNLNEDMQHRAEDNKAARAAHDTREQFISSAEKAAAHNPHIDQQVFRDIIAAYDAERPAFREQINTARRESPTVGHFNVSKRHAREETLEAIHKRVDHNGSAGTAAMHAIAAEQAPESFFTPIVRMFHNSDRGGVQFGAIGGAAAMGGLAYYMAQSSGAGSILSWVVTGAATLLGAYVGGNVLPNKPTVTIPNFRTPPVAGKGPVKSPSKAAEPEKAPEPTIQADAAKAPDASIQASTGKMPDVRITGTDIKHTELTGRESSGFTASSGPAKPTDKSLQV